MASCLRWLRVAVLLAAACPALAQPAFADDAAARGARLFDGAARFDKGGTPCAACHRAGSGGAAYGPDLTTVYTRYGGPKALDAVLGNIAFPAMVPVFANRPLTAQERADLIAYLRVVAQAHPQAQPPSPPARFAWSSLAYAAGLLVLAQLIWRKRLTGVRRELVNRKPR